MSSPYRWYLDPLVSWRSLDEHVLAHHAGSGDTHLLTPFSDRLLSVLPVQAPGRSLADLMTEPGVAELGTSEGEVADILIILQEAGIVHPGNGE